MSPIECKKTHPSMAEKEVPMLLPAIELYVFSIADDMLVRFKGTKILMNKCSSLACTGCRDKIHSCVSVCSTSYQFKNHSVIKEARDSAFTLDRRGKENLLETSCVQSSVWI